MIGELIIVLCCFDIIGSLGYVFTSLPTPKEDYVYGAVGNEASCKAQGFFIQIGTISLYINVSIAFYYLLIIQFSWREHRLKKSMVYFMLFAVPIVVGLIFAFAGIPYYDNALLWCNNSMLYWPETPVAIAIAVATVIMINLCVFVYKSERASRRFRRHIEDERDSLSKAFFKQSLVYLGAFYLTWPPYLALQVAIANGYAFSNYGFTLYAGTAVTLQGFWNYIFHVGLNGRKVDKVLMLRGDLSRLQLLVFPSKVPAHLQLKALPSIKGRSNQWNLGKLPEWVKQLKIRRKLSHDCKETSCCMFYCSDRCCTNDGGLYYHDL